MLCCAWIKHFMNTNELRSCGLCGQEIIFPFSHSFLRLDFRWTPRNVTYMKSCEVLHLISVNRPLRPWTVFNTFKQWLDTRVQYFLSRYGRCRRLVRGIIIGPKYDNIFNGKNEMFRSIVHSEWVYLTHSAKNAIFSNFRCVFNLMSHVSTTV
jgi:hypothetical protein